MKREVMRAKIVGMKKKPLKESEKRRPEKWYSMKKERAMRREREREREMLSGYVKQEWAAFLEDSV